MRENADGSVPLVGAREGDSGEARRPDQGGRPQAYLTPGELIASAEPCAVTTVLGSCVAVCLCDPERGIGGVNHFLLPSRASGQDGPRVGDRATRELIRRTVALGARPERLEAKVFGGACIAGERTSRNGHLGAQNVRVARNVLEEHGIPIVAAEVEGHHGRKLIYWTDSGTAWVKRL